jgi:hypothetical protein
MTITRKQANKMRGKLIALLDAADEYAHRGSMLPSDAQYVIEDYDRLKREFLGEIKNITDPSK